MKLSDLYAITSSSLQLSDNDLMLVADYNDYGIVSSKACSLKDLKNFINFDIDIVNKLNQLLAQSSFKDTISTNIDEYIINLIDNLKENGANQNDFIILTSAGFSFKNSNDIVNSSYFSSYITKSQHDIYNANTINLIDNLSKNYNQLNNSLSSYATNSYVDNEITSAKKQLISDVQLYVTSKLDQHVLKKDYNQLSGKVQQLQNKQLTSIEFSVLTTKISQILQKFNNN